MSHNAGHRCRCVKRHNPEPLEPERHHVWPLGNGGPDVAANRVWLCPTTHTNAHEILRHFMREGYHHWSTVLRMYDEPVSRVAYEVAVVGYFRTLQRTMTPSELPRLSFARFHQLDVS